MLCCSGGLLEATDPVGCYRWLFGRLNTLATAPDALAVCGRIRIVLDDFRFGVFQLQTFERIAASGMVHRRPVPIRSLNGSQPMV